MSRIIQKSRVPARRALSSLMALLMLLSAVVVALPLLAVLVPALSIKADAAPYAASYAGAQEALGNGDYFRAAQLAAGSFAFSDVDSSVPAAIGSDHTNNALWRGNVRLQDIPGADIFYNSTENVNEYLTRKGLDGLVTGISYWHYADGTSGHGGVDGAPAAGQIIEDVATSRRTLYWTSNAWRIESGTGAWSPPDADMRRGGVVPGTGATPAASTEPSTLPDIIQTKTRDISTALKEYPTIADIPASIYLEGNLVIGHERFSRRTLPNGLPGGGNYASGDNGSNYRETSIHTRQSWSNGYAADIRIYTDYLNKLQFVVDTTTNEDLSGVKTALNNVLPSITGVTVKDLVNVYTLGELESIRDAGSNPAGTATNDGATVATPRSWAEIRIPVVAAIQTANAHITEAQAQQIFDKYISNAPSAVAGQTQYALWYNKVVDAIAISKAFGAIKTFYSTETGALTNPNVGLDPKNVGFIVKTVPSIFANNGVKFTFAEATTLSIQLIADQADGGGHLYDTLDRVGTSKVTADDIDALATIGGNQLAALATLSSAGMGSQASGSRIQYVKDQWAEWGSGAINTNIVSATSGAAWAWVENCKLVAAAWFWAENKPIIDDFVATYKDITADFHIGARQIDDKNSDWNDAFPEGVAAVFNNGANLTPEQEALITGAYRVKNAEIPYSTYEILLYNTQGAFYKRVVEAVAAAQGITNVELYPAFTDLDTITKALKAESAYRTTIDETTNIVDEGGNPVVDENGVQQTFTQRVAGYEPQWYRERMFWADNWYPTTTLRAMNDENLAALLAQLEARRVDYFTMSDKAKGDLAALGHADWWDEIYCVTNPIDANPSHDRQTYVPETEWGKAVIPQRIDDVYYELARRFAEPVNAAMAEYAKYDASGQVKIDGNIATVDMEQIGPLRTLISQIPANVLDALLNHAQGLTYINNASVYPTTDLNEPAKIYSLTGTYNTLYGTRSSADQAYAAQWADVSGRTIIGDWLFLKFLVSDVIKEFEENPEKYWAHTRSWQWSNDGGVTSNGTTELTGLYVTRYGDTITVDGDPVDVARKPGEDFNVEGHRVNSFLNSLDGLIGKDGNIKDILAALGVDLSSVGVDVETATTVNVNTILQSLVTNSLYTDELVNTLLTYLYGMVLPMFENVFANFKDAINPSSLPQFGTDTHLDIYSLHELLANGTGPEKTSNDRNVYDIAGSTKPIGSSNTDKTDGNAFNIESRSNVNTLTDLRLYPDLLGGILDNTFSASDPYYTGGKKSPKEQLTSPVATGLNGYTIGGGTAIDIEKPRVVSWNGSNTGYGYNIDTWKNASIFQQTLNPDGTPVWEVLGESGLDDDPSTPYIDESKIYDTTKPVGTLTLDWGINAQTDPTARATRFKAALGNALAGVFPLVQALLLGIEYQGFVPKVGKLEGGSKKNITGGDSAYNGEAYMWYATYTQGAAAVPMVVPSISLKLSASGNDGFAKVITPILELLAGLDGSTGAKSVYNKIPTVDQLRSFKDTTKPGFPARLDQADQAGYWGTQSMGYNASHFAGYDMRYNNWGYTYGTQTREASKGFVNALFAPIDQFLLNLGEKPIRELLRLLPSLSYALSLDRIAPLLAGLETIITPDVNGLVQLQVPSGINSLVGDLPNGALQGGSYMTDNIYVNFGRRQDGAFRHSFSAGTGDDIWGIRHDGGYWNTPGDVNIDEYFYGSKPGYALYMNKRLY
ncbi:MAG: hypothetical protein LBN05_06760, partial [Oscillospiraceae bacterium]|nr:hypothetical protein [Oscillospiraceae bacterium]